MTEGILSRLQYDYAGKYFVSASYRSDASSVFHKDNRWGNFGSVGAAWLITKEDFMDDYSSWLDALKLKASWGVQGNDAILDADGYRVYYAYTDRYAVFLIPTKRMNIPRRCPTKATKTHLGEEQGFQHRY